MTDWKMVLIHRNGWRMQALTGTNIYKNLGFTVSAKYQSNYYWQSFLVNGNVPSMFTMQCRLTICFCKTFN